MTPRVLLDGLAIGESARWQDGRLWFANWGTGEIIAVDLDARREVRIRLPAETLPISFDWLPDGRLLVVAGTRLLRQEPDGSLVTHADLGGLSQGFNEIVVDGAGRAYVNGGDFDFATGGGSGMSSSSDRTEPARRWPRTSRSATGWRSRRTARR